MQSGGVKGVIPLGAGPAKRFLRMPCLFFGSCLFAFISPLLAYIVKKQTYSFTFLRFFVLSFCLFVFCYIQTDMRTGLQAGLCVLRQRSAVCSMCVVLSSGLRTTVTPLQVCLKEMLLGARRWKSMNQYVESSRVTRHWQASRRESLFCTVLCVSLLDCPREGERATASREGGPDAWRAGLLLFGCLHY